MIRTTVLAGLACAMALGSAGCDNRGPMEKAGEKVDHTVDTIKNGGHEPVGDSIKDVNVAAAQLKLFEKLQPKPLGSMQESDWKQSIEYLAKYLNIENAPSDTAKYYTDEFLPKS